MVLIGRMYRAQNIEVNIVLFQHFPAAHHLIKTARTTFIHAIRIMQFLRPIHTQPNQEIVFLEKFGPFVIQLRAVGLHRMLTSIFYAWC